MSACQAARPFGVKRRKKTRVATEGGGVDGGDRRQLRGEMAIGEGRMRSEIQMRCDKMLPVL